MKNKKYGSCSIKYAEEDTCVYIEYYETYTYNNRGEKVFIFVCKDLITGTPLNTIPLSDSKPDINAAAESNQIQKGHLIAYDIFKSSKQDMLELFKSLNEGKVKKYVKMIERAKEKYSDALKMADAARIEKLRLEKMKDETLESEIRRVKGIAQRVRRFK